MAQSLRMTWDLYGRQLTTGGVMSSAWTSLVQAQHKGFSQLSHAFDARVHEHESLLGVNPITGKASAKRKRSENKNPLETIGMPGNEQEKTLVNVCDQECVVLETRIDRFLSLFANAKTEPDQAKLLQVLENTAKKENQHSTNVVRAFESSGGLKTAKTWLETAVSFNQFSFLELVLTVLKVLPLTLASITEARINEPIVALRKSASNAQVKRAAQELLKTWRSKFTEKSPKETNGSPPPKQPSPTAATAPTSTRVPTKSNTLLTNLLMKPKDNKPTKVKDLTLTKMLKEKQIKDKEVGAQAESPKTPVALPPIVSFGDVKATDTPSVASTKRIRWADNHGKELTQIQIIESWRDMVYHTEDDDKQQQPMAAHPTDSFKDAKLREHASEKNALKNKLSERLTVIKPTMEWRTPVMIQFPEDVQGRPADLSTEETNAQTNRTRKDVEWILLGTEVPPPSPHEWVRSSADIFLGPPIQIALSDGTPDEHHHEYFSPAPVSQEASSKTDFVSSTFGSLDKSTISLLLDNEHILGQVYDEVLRTRRRITDARIHEILNASRHYGNAVVAPPVVYPPGPHGYPRPNTYSTDSSSRNSMYDHHGYPPAGATNKRPYDGYNDPSSYAPKRHQTAPLAYTPPQYSPENNDPYGRAGVQRPLPMQTGGRPQAIKYNRPTYATPSRPTANGGRGY